MHAQLVVEVEHVEVRLRHLLSAEEREQARDEGARHGQREREPPAEEWEEEELAQAHLERVELELRGCVGEQRRGWEHGPWRGAP